MRNLEALWPGDRHYLNEDEMDDFYDNVIHSAMESALCAYLAKEQNKVLGENSEHRRHTRISYRKSAQG